MVKLVLLPFVLPILISSILMLSLIPAFLARPKKLLMAPMFPATVVFSTSKPLKYFLNLSIQL
jgi:hypothetical protein